MRRAAKTGEQNENFTDFLKITLSDRIIRSPIAKTVCKENISDLLSFSHCPGRPNFLSLYLSPTLSSSHTVISTSIFTLHSLHLSHSVVLFNFHYLLFLLTLFLIPNLNSYNVFFRLNFKDVQARQVFFSSLCIYAFRFLS
jgi:hypothetical protein